MSAAKPQAPGAGAGIAAAAAADAPWRRFSPLGPEAALIEVDQVVKARRSSEAWAAKCAAQTPEGAEARWRRDALETARQILADVAAASRTEEAKP